MSCRSVIPKLQECDGANPITPLPLHPARKSNSKKIEKCKCKCNYRVIINSVQTRCIVKARLRKVHFSGDFLGV